MILVWGTSGRRFKSCRSHYTLVTQIVPSRNTDMIELENISEILDNACVEIERANPKLQGVLTNISYNKKEDYSDEINFVVNSFRIIS